jgi:hypothetical protein
MRPAPADAVADRVAYDPARATAPDLTPPEIGHEGTAEPVAKSTDPDREPIKAERTCGQVPRRQPDGEVHVGASAEARRISMAVALSD